MDKILVVDDDTLFLESLKRGLKKYETHFYTFFASSVENAVEIMKNEPIAVLVTDMVMPGKDGLDLFAYKDQFHPRTQCIIMSGYGTEDLIKSVQDDNAFSYLQKPFQISELGRAVMRAMEARDEGRLINPVLLSSLLKLIQVKKATCIMTAKPIGKTGKGTLYFIDGVLSGAQCEDQNGPDAARRVLQWTQVNFDFQKLTSKIMHERMKTGISISHPDKDSILSQMVEQEDPVGTGTDRKDQDFDFDDMVEEALDSIMEDENEPEDEKEDLKDGFAEEAMGNEFGEEMSDSQAKPLRLLIVDDSKMMRKVIADIFRSEPGIRVVGECENGKEALEAIQRQKVDVMTLDVEMPVMDGLTTLKHLMIKKPLPAVMVSSLTQEGASATFDALKFGAVDFVAKPSRLSETDLAKQSIEIIRKIKLAADVEIRSVQFIRGRKNHRNNGNSVIFEHPRQVGKIFTIGAGEGGYGALLKILPRLPDQFQGTCIVMLHAASKHVDAFVNYLKQYCRITIKRAVNVETLQCGCCYFGSGEEYLTIEQADDDFMLRVSPAPRFSNRSNINIMMFSAAEMMHRHAIGMILSGSGTDGCEGMGEIRRGGGKTLVQAPGNCIYKEMPESVINKIQVYKILSDTEIASEMINDNYEVELLKSHKSERLPESLQGNGIAIGANKEQSI